MARIVGMGEGVMTQTDMTEGNKRVEEFNER